MYVMQVRSGSIVEAAWNTSVMISKKCWPCIICRQDNQVLWSVPQHRRVKTVSERVVTLCCTSKERCLTVVLIPAFEYSWIDLLISYNQVKKSMSSTERERDTDWPIAFRSPLGGQVTLFELTSMLKLRVPPKFSPSCAQTSRQQNGVPL